MFHVTIHCDFRLDALTLCNKSIHIPADQLVGSIWIVCE